jgi:hypothetical protein
MHEKSVITKEVRSLPRLPHHGEPKVAFEDERFDRTQPVSPVEVIVATISTPGAISRLFASSAS